MESTIDCDTHNTFTKLYVDDERDTPAGWDRAYNVWEALFKLDILEYHEVSLDHDLSSFIGTYKELTGLDIVNWLVQRKIEGKYVPPIVKVHSANPVGKKAMQDLIDQYLS